MKDRFRVTLCCPRLRQGFGPGELRCEDEIRQMEEYLKQADGEIVVFPEGYLPSGRVNEAEALAERYGKWLITGSEDEGDEKSLYVLVVSPEKGTLYSHCKTALTEGDRNSGAQLGKTIDALDTPFGRIGTVLCYELHFPEVARIECLHGARILFNTIGTGMWHEQQLSEWTTLARARAIENRCFVLGCTHYCDPIPMMFAYDPHGRELLLERNREGLAGVDIGMDLIDERDYFRDRNPEAYTDICKGEYES